MLAFCLGMNITSKEEIPVEIECGPYNPPGQNLHCIHIITMHFNTSMTKNTSYAIDIPVLAIR